MSKLYFRYGAMNAGKSAALLQTAYNYKEKNKKVILIKPKLDTKGGNKITSRIGISSDVDILLGFGESLNKPKYKKIIKNSDCILVDESQFLSEKQVEELWLITKKCDIPVICYGIKTNFQSKLFEGSKRLLELSDELEELATICSCGQKARFNARIINGKYVTVGDNIEIDNNEKIKYESLCGNCYIKKVIEEASEDVI